MFSVSKLPANSTVDTRSEHLLQAQPARFIELDSDAGHTISSYLELNEVAKLATSCTSYHSIFQKNIPKYAVQQLLQAVIDDDRNKVKRMLNVRPELLLEKPNSHLILESKHTWQRFYAEDVLTIAVKRKQIEIIKILLPYFDILKQPTNLQEIKMDSLAKWSCLSFYENTWKREQIYILEEYKNHIQSLIDLFTQENFPVDNLEEDNLSPELKRKLDSFRSEALPKDAIKLDDYFDIELMLYASIEIYSENLENFLNLNQHRFFCVKIIGFLQSLVTPETGKIWCSSLLYVNNGSPVSGDANSHKLWEGEDFYRSSRDAQSGLGFDYFCCGIIPMLSKQHRLWSGNLNIEALRKYWDGILRSLERTMRNKSETFSELIQHQLLPQLHQPRKLP